MKLPGLSCMEVANMGKGNGDRAGLSTARGQGRSLGISTAARGPKLGMTCVHVGLMVPSGITV